MTPKVNPVSTDFLNTISGKTSAAMDAVARRAADKETLIDLFERMQYERLHDFRQSLLLASINNLNQPKQLWDSSAKVRSWLGTGLSDKPTYQGKQYQGKGIGKITDYGQRDDPYMDSYTLAGKSAIGNITPNFSMAFSPDVESYAKQKGIKIGDKVKVKLGDGTTIIRRFDDRTRKDLRGRIDLHTSKGANPYREFTVADIEPYTSE